MFARDNLRSRYKTRVVAQCRDADFERLVRATFGMDAKVELDGRDRRVRRDGAQARHRTARPS